MNLRTLGAVGRVLTRTRYRGVPDLLPLLVRRPAILAAMSAYETALVVSSRGDPRLKTLATLKASALVGCPF